MWNRAGVYFWNWGGPGDVRVVYQVSDAALGGIVVVFRLTFG
jgi:hypothetical protein